VGYGNFPGKVGASRKGNIFVKVPLPAGRKGHFPATRSGSAADPFIVKLADPQG